ncbi:M14 family zinc carboxypeptidase, partial [candidate division KSB1 bacterium]
MKEFHEFQLLTTWDFYPTYNAYDSLIHKFAIDYPSICRVFTIGTLPSGREIFMAKISDSVDNKENEPRFLYTSTIHGDETTGYILMLHFIEYLLSNYGIDLRITNIINNVEIWINPNANPDGTYALSNQTVYGATRNNANGIDLNRNYPDPQDGQHPDANAWQPETIIFMNLADSLNFVMSANFHGGSELVNYPWDTWAQYPADNSWWLLVSNEYADTAQAYSPPGYLDDFGTGVVNGYTWYSINGGRMDYMNYFHYCREVTMEISLTKLLPQNQLISHWNYNFRSLLNYLEQCLYGIRGIVSDSITGLPLQAKVFISSHDTDSSHVYSSLPVGNYHRLLYTGSYNVSYTAPGYIPKTINNINVINYYTTVVDVQLVPELPFADFYTADTSSCTGLIEFQSQSSPTITNYIWDFGDGTTSSIKDPIHQYLSNGVYTVKLKVINPVGSDSIIKTNYLSINMPSAPVVSDSAHCGPASFILNATGIGQINWYDAYSGGNLLDTGSSLNITYLDSSTTYYLQSEVAQIPLYAGKIDNSGGGGYYSSNYSHYLIFDCYQPFTIQSVKVYANGSGNRTISLRDQNGNVIQSTIVNIPNGQSRITLGFNVPVGINLQLAGPLAPNLYRNDGGTAYPYEIQGILKIKQSSANSNPTSYYYYFYDWEVIPEPCLSPMIPLNLTINQGTPVTDFTYTINNNSANFNNISIDGNHYLWDFGDGNNSNLVNPSHTFQSLGNYTVSLKSINSCGSDSISKIIGITGTDDFGNKF